MTDLEARPERAPGVRMRNVRGTTMIAHGAEVFALTDVAGLIWRSCDGVTSLREIAGAIASEYDVAPEQAESDLIEFVTELREHGFLTS